MSEKFLFNVTNGLATLGPAAVRIRELLEARFLAWAGECGAEPMLFPPLMKVEDLDGLDYFRNFPHLALIASRIRPDYLTDEYTKAQSTRTIPNAHLTASEYVLPSAACYNIYLHLRNTVLESAKYVTTVAGCFRNEQEYNGLARLWGFSMREIVCIGPAEAVQAHLTSCKQRVVDFAAAIGLPLEIQVASDPFYQPLSSRAVMQKLFPVKEEFVYCGTVAIASVNFHRNFFGERCNILTKDEQPAFSGCQAFGIERWLYALLDYFKQDGAAIEQAIAI
jgi:seryl-tRNA synthetase